MGPKTRKGSVRTVDIAGVQVPLWLPEETRINAVVKPSDALLAETVAQIAPTRVLEIGSSAGVVGLLAALSGWSSVVRWVANSRWTGRVLERSLEAAPTLDAAFVFGESPLDAPSGHYDVVIVHQQPSRALNEHWLRQGASRLSGEGHLLVAGATNEGIRVAASDLEGICADVDIAGVARGHRVIAGCRPLIRESGPLPVTEHMEDLNGANIRWTTVPGVFHADGVDRATRLLLETVVLPRKGRLLDLGCGAGVMGLSCAVRAPKSTVTMADDSVAAVNRARDGVERNGLGNARVVLSDRICDLDGERFDVVLTNPPVHAGGSSDSRLPIRFVEDAARAIGRKGRLWLVTSPTVPVMKPMRELFTEVRIAADNGSFRVYDAIRRPPRHV